MIEGAVTGARIAAGHLGPGLLAISILVVEDEALVRDLIARELEDAGYVVIEADTGEEAMEVLERTPVGVLFTDIRLPGAMNGWVLAEQARALSPNLPVIYSTGFSAEAPRLVQGSILVKKPYLPSSIIRVLDRLLGPRSG